MVGREHYGLVKSYKREWVANLLDQHVGARRPWKPWRLGSVCKRRMLWESQQCCQKISIKTGGDNLWVGSDQGGQVAAERLWMLADRSMLTNCAKRV